ncbi:2-oxoglutarate oxidoreductase, alpha subunit [Candidatus Rhodobacter oscarellae]|uniref:2-oxoglutarate oxidoreductase, alpha subunit n=1 Tax=Candidatus Rhodobacter oscarellae TaxID=1675527 RepID=A0A0J9E512_9RHOB|nr:2-oxoacid:acceptor oxidoreductase subunit alpha [Candidatus Rhodobacter lobularis]KMW57890.1 2-oxoglutarate oxidoreductase, alpha subunit [Candidatus Rhodobacter lobularis]
MPPSEPVVNEFVLKFGTVNGSGSASANLLCAKALFRMGIPVSAKNIFPSNIQGLPTWYEIRASQAGHTGRREGVDVMVAMNPQSYKRDSAEVLPGGILIYDSTFPRDFGRDDIHVVGIPIARIVAKHWTDTRQRQLFKNLLYVGALISLIGLDNEVVEASIEQAFKSKPKLIAPNLKALHLGRDWVAENVDMRARVRAARTDKTDGKIMITGNEAAGLGAVYAGATVATWYPITPSTSLVENFERHAERFRRREDGTLNAAVIQAEDELAAIGMAIGASWNGARSFTATSGPGISLMEEFIGLAYFAEIPLVLFNVQRGGPSTGMPTRTQQSDILTCAYASHGDTGHILLMPSDPSECFTMAVDAFDFADRYQTPIFVMSDLDVGMNDWVVDALEWDDARRPDRGKVMDAAMLEEAEFARYRDVDGDGIPYRTYPGTHPDKGAYFTRGTSHTDTGGYTEDARIHAEMLDRIKRKIDGAAEALPQPVVSEDAATRLAVVSFGATDLAVREGLDLLAGEGLAMNHMRLRAFPFAKAVKEFADRHDYLFVIEQNRDSQMRHLLLAEAEIAHEKLIALPNMDGMPLTAAWVRHAVREAMGRLGLLSARISAE